MKTAVKCKNNEFLVIILKHVNRLGTRKMCAIAHENSLKRENDEFLGHISQTCIGSYPHTNPPGTPKQWAIAHENGHKTQKQRVLWTHSGS